MVSLLGSRAVAYAAVGFKVFPLSPGTKVPLKGSHGHLDATTDEGIIRKWWHEQPQANIGLACAASGLVVIDADRHDPKKDGVRNLMKLCGTNTFPDTCVAITGSDTLGIGFHYVFKHPGCELKQNLGSDSGIDIKNRGFILLEPSILSNGKMYRWIEGRSLLEFAPAPVPDWLLFHIRKPEPTPCNAPEQLTYACEGDKERILEALHTIPPDLDYHDWLRIGAALKREGFPLEVWDAWSSGGQKYKPGECARKWRSF